MRKVYPSTAGGGAGAAFPIDRNPNTVLLNYSAQNIAPHARTQRFTYTVPALKEAWLAWMHTQVESLQNPTTNLYSYASIEVNLGAGLVIVLRTSMQAVNVRNPFMAQGMSYIILFAGDTLEAFTADASTGSNQNYEISAAVVEYDPT